MMPDSSSERVTDHANSYRCPQFDAAVTIKEESERKQVVSELVRNYPKSWFKQENDFDTRPLAVIKCNEAVINENERNPILYPGPSSESADIKSPSSWHADETLDSDTCRFRLTRCSEIPRQRNLLSFTCADCFEKFKGIKNLNMHILKAHSFDRPYSCEQCSARFKTKSNLKNHSMSHSEARPYSCPDCSVTFKARHHCRAHQKIHNAEDPLCKKRFYILCLECPAILREENFRRHQKVHSTEKPLSCPECPKKFRLNSYLTDHLISHSEEKTFSCAHCSHKCKKKYNLKIHILKHLDKGPFNCPACPATFECKDSILKHGRKVHSTQKLFLCKRCPEKFRAFYSLMKHFARHCGKKSFSCAHCSYKCNQKGDMRRHMLRHFTEPHACPQCSAKFERKFELDRHFRRVHSSDKPLYLCDKCSAVYSAGSSLKRHLATHEAELVS